MTNTDIWRIALEQSAIDSCCAPEDFQKQENVIAVSRENAGRRAYLNEPYSFDFTSYGRGVVACVREDLQAVARSFLEKYPAAHCFETPALHELDEMLAPYGLKTCFQAEYFLPDLNALRAQPSTLELRVLQPADFSGLYLPQWGNALCAERRQTPSVWALTTGKRSLRSRGRAPTARICGRSASTSFPHTGGRGWRRR